MAQPSKSTTKWCENYVKTRLPKSLIPEDIPTKITEIGDGNMNYVFNVSNELW